MSCHWITLTLTQCGKKATPMVQCDPSKCAIDFERYSKYSLYTLVSCFGCAQLLTAQQMEAIVVSCKLYSVLTSKRSFSLPFSSFFRALLTPHSLSVVVSSILTSLNRVPLYNNSR